MQQLQCPGGRQRPGRGQEGPVFGTQLVPSAGPQALQIVGAGWLYLMSVR